MNPELTRRRFLQATAATAGAAAFAGRFATGAKAQDKKYKFVWSPKATDNPVFAVAREGRQDPLDRARRCRVRVGRALQHGCRAAGLRCSMRHHRRMRRHGHLVQRCHVLLPVIDRATAAGIPVITWDSDSDQSTAPVLLQHRRRRRQRQQAPPGSPR